MAIQDKIMNAFGWTRTLPDGKQVQIENTEDGYSAFPVDEPKNDAVPAVWSCINLLAGVMARLPVRVVKYDENGIAEPQMDHAITDVLQEPTLHYDTYSFYETFYRRFFRTGNGYMAINRENGGTGDISTLTNCMSGIPSVGQVTAPSGRQIPGIRYQLDLAPINPRTIDVGPEGVINVHGPGLDINGLYSPSPILYAAKTAIQSYGLASKRNRKSLINGLATSLLFTSTASASKPDPESLKALNTLVNEFINGYENSGKAAVLPPTITPANLGSLSAVELKVIDIMRWDITDICRVFSVPPRLIGYYETGVRAENARFERSVTDFIKWNLEPHIRRFESAFSKKLLSLEDRRNGYRILFDIDNFSAGTLRERAEISELMVSRSGTWTPNEGRAFVDGKAPLTGGNVLLQPKGAPTQDNTQSNQQSDT